MLVRKLSIVASTLAAVGMFALAPAAQAGSSAEKMKAWDPDADGTLDMAETRKAAEARFDSLEGDNDGTLDRKEMKPTKVDKGTFAKADPDKDGTLSKEEYMTIVESRFRAADPDNDGTVSVAELDSKAGKLLMRLMK